MLFNHKLIHSRANDRNEGLLSFYTEAMINDCSSSILGYIGGISMPWKEREWVYNYLFKLVCWRRQIGSTLTMDHPPDHVGDWKTILSHTAQTTVYEGKARPCTSEFVAWCWKNSKSIGFRMHEAVVNGYDDDDGDFRITTVICPKNLDYESIPVIRGDVLKHIPECVASSSRNLSPAVKKVSDTYHLRVFNEKEKEWLNTSYAY